MKNLEIRANSVKEAIQQALGRLGVSRAEVKVAVLKEDRRGILSMEEWASQSQSRAISACG